MKLIALVALLAFLQPGLSLYGQQFPPLISLSEKNVPLEKILDLIEKKTRYTHFGEATWTKVARNVTIDIKDATVAQVLAESFRGQQLEYELDNNSINIRVMDLLHGKAINARGEPVPSATVQIRGVNWHTISNDSGVFYIRVPSQGALLLVSSINYETLQFPLTGTKEVVVSLKDKISELSDVAVVAQNGYQRIPRERATGSFSTVSRVSIERGVSPNLLERINGLTSSLLLNKNTILQTNSSAISIRGRSTILANPQPLIIVDNFVYNGNIYNINPEDVESVTVLKDAAASSIWGALAGNGVMVITTRQGKYKQEPHISFSSSLNVGKKPNLYYLPVLSPGDYIDVERRLFDSSFYNGIEANPTHPVLSPVVELLIKERNESPADRAIDEAQINVLRGQDTRRDLDKYFYRHNLDQRYFLNLSGGSSKNQYYFSVGYDKDIASLVRNQYERVTLNGSNTYILCPKKLELSTGFAYTSSTTRDNNSGIISPPYPYLRLVDAKGKALTVPLGLRQTYKDTAVGAQLLDWNYRPYDELLNADNTIHLTDYRINIGIKYQIAKGLDAYAYYQYAHGSSVNQNLQSDKLYYTRDLINEYTQIGQGMLMRPIPLGGILDKGDTGYSANHVRLQLNYDHRLGPDGVLTAIAGVEVRDVEGSVNDSRLYGYNKDLQSSQPVNYIPFYLHYADGMFARIPYLDHTVSTSDHYISYYFNGSYNYRKRYILSASARKDESNIFGARANDKGIRLYSIGTAWEISGEDFYRISALPILKLRLTHGYSGNVDKSVSAYTTAQLNSGFNSYGSTSATITNPPNPSLRWEQIHIVNMGMDFAGKDGRVEGSLEYYIKNGSDLIGLSALDPTTGNTQLKGNSAGMKAHGIDLVLNTQNINGSVSWTSSFLFSYTQDKVTKYDTSVSANLNLNPGSVAYYLDPNVISPLVGHPLYSIYALRWMGLDPVNGDPQGWLNGHISKDYKTMINSSDFKNLIYKGTANPNFFGSLRNTISWQQFGLSFNILYKFGYYFRRSSINYFNLFNIASRGHPDYEKRWQDAGDEKRTSVPSLAYPANSDRDLFYSESEVLIEKGDHIRLQDLRISYDLQKKLHPGLPLRAIQFYLYANNIGIIWKANHQGIDPDNVMSIPNPRTLAAGIKMDL